MHLLLSVSSTVQTFPLQFDRKHFLKIMIKPFIIHTALNMLYQFIGTSMCYKLLVPDIFYTSGFQLKTVQVLPPEDPHVSWIPEHVFLKRFCAIGTAFLSPSAAPAWALALAPAVLLLLACDRREVHSFPLVNPSPMERLIHFLLFSGLCLLTQAISRQYVLIQEKKTWHEAQAYCRQNHIDLATVQSTEDWTNVQKTVESPLNSITWIGIYNDIDSWQWSYRDENITFKLWATGEPTNGNEECALLWSGTWSDYPCNYEFCFVCYNENGTNKFIFISHFWTTWREARSYCRQHYTDLAIIRSPSENNQLASMTKGYNAWIGLNRDSWMWSNGSKVNLFSINWLTGQPDVTGLNQPCGAIRADGLIEDGLCSDVLPFICLTYSRTQIVRVEVKSGKRLNDTAVMETILQFITQKARDHGIHEETRLTWKVQSDGNVFSVKRDQDDGA